MGNRGRAGQLDTLVAIRPPVEVVEEPLSAAEEDGDDRQVQFVDQAGVKVLPHGWRASADPDVWSKLIGDPAQ